MKPILACLFLLVCTAAQACPAQLQQQVQAYYVQPVVQQVQAVEYYQPQQIVQQVVVQQQIRHSQRQQINNGGAAVRVEQRGLLGRRLNVTVN